MKINTLSFLFIALLMFAFSFFSSILIETDKLLLNSLAEQITAEQLDDVLHFNKKWQWLSYVLIPILLLLKVAVIALILDLGCFFFNKEIKYKKLFNIVVKVEFVFLLVIVFKTVWFYFFKTNYTFEDLQYFQL